MSEELNHKEISEGNRTPSRIWRKVFLISAISLLGIAGICTGLYFIGGTAREVAQLLLFLVTFLLFPYLFLFLIPVLVYFAYKWLIRRFKLEPMDAVAVFGLVGMALHFVLGFLTFFLNTPVGEGFPTEAMDAVGGMLFLPWMGSALFFLSPVFLAPAMLIYTIAKIRHTSPRNILMRVLAFLLLSAGFAVWDIGRADVFHYTTDLGTHLRAETFADLDEVQSWCEQYLEDHSEQLEKEFRITIDPEKEPKYIRKLHPRHMYAVAWSEDSKESFVVIDWSGHDFGRQLQVGRRKTFRLEHMPQDWSTIRWRGGMYTRGR